jgi:hypothetical protein
MCSQGLAAPDDLSTSGARGVRRGGAGGAIVTAVRLEVTQSLHQTPRNSKELVK